MMCKHSESISDPEEEDVYLTTEESGVAEILLARPQKRNALTWGMWSALGVAIERAATDDRIRAVVIRGAGKAFCAGGDLITPAGRGSGPLGPAARLELAQKVIIQLYRLRKPTVAAVEGYAVGVGWSLALACDLIVASDNAYFWAPFVERSLVPDGGLAWFLVQRLGHHRAASSVLLGERIDAAVAATQGLVTYLVAPGKASQVAREVAFRLVGRDAHALELSKGLLTAAGGVSLGDFLELELYAATIALNAPGASETRREFSISNSEEHG